MSVIVTWYGQSCFHLQYGAWSCVVDPYRPNSVPGLPPLQLLANAVYSSHSHDDHTGIDSVTITESPLPKNVFIEEVLCPHDDQQGEKMGMVTARIFHLGDIRIAHLGDIGCMPSDALMQQISDADALMLPVGGVFTIDEKTAKTIADCSKARVILPMHYKTDHYGVPPLHTLDRFLALCTNIVYYPGATLELSKDTPAQVAILRV